MPKKNKFKGLYKKYMIRPIVYQGLAKALITVVVSLLWNMFLNKAQLMSVVRDAFFVFGFIWLMLAWFQYLKLDGFTIRHFMEERKNKGKKKNHWKKDIADFMDEEVVAFRELEDDEKAGVRLASNLILAVILFIISIAAMVF